MTRCRISPLAAITVLACNKCPTHLALCLVGLLSACAHTAFTPPSRAVPLQTAATVGEGSMSVQGQFATHGAFYGPGILSGALRFTYGVNNTADVVVDASILRVTAQSGADTNRNVFLGRAGFKIGDRNVAFSIGGGGGYSPAGGPLVSFDAATTLAYEHCRIVPFISAGGFVSNPIRPHRVELTPAGGDVVFDRPVRTVGVSANAGAKLSLDTRCLPARVALLAGLGVALVATTNEKEWFLSAAAAIEVRL